MSTATPHQPAPISSFFARRGAYYGSVALVTAIAGLFFNYCFYGKEPGLSLPVYILFMLVTGLCLHRCFKGRAKTAALLLALGSLFFAGMIFFRASPALIFFNFVASFTLGVLLLRSLAGDRLQSYTWGRYVIAALWVPAQVLVRAGRWLGDLIAMRTGLQKRRHAVPIIRGILLALPLLVVLLLLLSSADQVFSRYLGQVFSFNLPEDLIGKAIVFVIAAFIYSGFVGLAVEGGKGVPELPVGPAKSHLGRIEYGIILGSIAVVFLLFLVIQVQYLFGGQAQLEAMGFTYAEYARRGFFELVAVGAIIFFLLLAMDRYVERRGERHLASFLSLSTVLIAEVVALMASAFLRLKLYEQAYGFTNPRFYVYAATMWLAIVMVLLLIKIIRHLPWATLTSHLFLSVVLGLIVINLINPEAFIARRNVERFQQTGEVDVRYLGSLSADAVPIAAQLLAMPQVEASTTDAYLSSVARYYDFLKQQESASWQSQHWAHQRALQVLEPYQQQLESAKETAGEAVEASDWP